MVKVTLAIVLLAIIGAWFLLLRPTFLGGPVGYVIVRGESMQPSLHTNDLVITRKQSAYDIGDVAAFRADGGIVIHRIIGGNGEEGYILQGDNRSGPDSWHPTNEDVIGRQWLHVPGAGRVLAFLQQPLVLASIAGMVVLLSLSGDSKKRDKDNPAKSPRQRKKRGQRPAQMNGLNVGAITVASLGLLALVLATAGGIRGDRR